MTNSTGQSDSVTTKQNKVTYCFVIQKHFLKSQKIGKGKQHVEYVTGHFVFMVPAKDRGAGSHGNGGTD